MDQTMAKKNIGSRLDEFLAEEGILEDVSRVASERIEAAFECMIERGMSDVREGRLIPDDEMRQRIELWGADGRCDGAKRKT